MPENDDQNDIALERDLEQRLARIRIASASMHTINVVTIASMVAVLCGFVAIFYWGHESRDELVRSRDALSRLQGSVSELANKIQSIEQSSRPVNTTTGDAYWIETGIQADWNGRDIAYTRGIIPKLAVGNLAVCNKSTVGSIAVCWQNRTDGYPRGQPTDFQGIAQAWCTYKNKSIQVSTPPDGQAPPGIVFLCSAVVAQ